MNCRKILGCAACCVFLAFSTCAQNASPHKPVTDPTSVLFEQFPTKISCNNSSLDRLFSRKGNHILTQVPGILLRGEVIARVRQNAEVQSINIRLSDFPDVLFTLSRLQLEDGSIRYTGHILGSDQREGMVLSLEEGKYYFTKTEKRLIIAD